VLTTAVELTKTLPSAAMLSLSSPWVLNEKQPLSAFWASRITLASLFPLAAVDIFNPLLQSPPENVAISVLSASPYTRRLTLVLVVPEALIATCPADVMRRYSALPSPNLKYEPLPALPVSYPSIYCSPLAPNSILPKPAVPLYLSKLNLPSGFKNALVWLLE